MFSFSSLKKSTVTNAGWALSSLCDSNDAVTVATETGLSIVGAYEGAAIGAEIGCIGGPAGAVIGGVIGSL